jgi:hypothetical protein
VFRFLAGVRYISLQSVRTDSGANPAHSSVATVGSFASVKRQVALIPSSDGSTN